MILREGGERGRKRAFGEVGGGKIREKVGGKRGEAEENAPIYDRLLRDERGVYV